MPRLVRSKRWCFTLNNPQTEEVDSLQSLVDRGLAGYVILGNEKGESGTPHLQGYLELKKKHSLKQVKQMIGPRCHLEIARGNFEENYRYCSKEGDFITLGEPMKQVFDDWEFVCNEFNNEFDAWEYHNTSYHHHF